MMDSLRRELIIRQDQNSVKLPARSCSLPSGVPGPSAVGAGLTGAQSSLWEGGGTCSGLPSAHPHNLNTIHL